MTANPTFDDLVTTTLRRRTGKLADNVSANNALLSVLDTKGNKVMVNGGRTLVRELDYQENSTFAWYSGYDILDISPSDTFTAAEFDWKQAAVSVTASGLQKRQNSGKERTIALVKSRIKNAERTMKNNISTGVFSDGTLAGGRQIGGLQLLVADDPTTGTVGGIDRASFAFWRNVAFDATTDGGAAATAANIQGYMKEVYLQLVRGSDSPDMIVADSNYYQLFWESLTDIQRITKVDKATSGFESLEFAGPGGRAAVLLDQATSTNHMYFLNTDFIFYEVHTEADMVPLGEQRSINQDANVNTIIFQGNMTLSNASLQGVLKD